jgi:Ca2+/Na+ antiporter
MTALLGSTIFYVVYFCVLSSFYLNYIWFDRSIDPPFVELKVFEWVESLGDNFGYNLVIIVISFGIVAALFGLLGHGIRRKFGALLFISSKPQSPE